MWRNIITGAAGAILAVATLALLETVTGWLGGLVAPTVPSGSVIAFDRTDLDQDNCPPGWDPFKESRGRVIVGAGNPSAAPGAFGSDENATPLTNRALRQHGGAEKHKLIIDEMARHHHPVTGRDEWGHSNTGNGRRLRLVADDGPPWENVTGPMGTGAVGKGKPHNNMPPYIALYLCKKE